MYAIINLLAKAFASVRLVYNHYLDMKIKVYKESQESVSYYKCAKDLVTFNKEKKTSHKSYTTICINQNIKLENVYLVLPKVKAVKIKQHRRYLTYKLQYLGRYINKRKIGKLFSLALKFTIL